MGVIDIEAVRTRIVERDARQQEAAAWCTEALREFAGGINALATPARGNPDFMKHVFGGDAGNGVWPILRADSPDNVMIELGHGATMTISGAVWARGEKSTFEDVGLWIAVRCGYSIDVARSVFEAALMGESWTVSEALRAAGKL